MSLQELAEAIVEALLTDVLCKLQVTDSEKQAMIDTVWETLQNSERY